MVKRDMRLEVLVRVDGHLDADGQVVASATYQQTWSDPESPGVVCADGHVELIRMAFDEELYNLKTDITFNLEGQITDGNGGAVPFSFPADPEEAVRITIPPGGNQEQITPRSGTSRMQLILDDEDDHSDTYDYCLLPRAQTPTGEQVFKLDPRIINR